MRAAVVRAAVVRAAVVERGVRGDAELGLRRQRQRLRKPARRDVRAAHRHVELVLGAAELDGEPGVLALEAVRVLLELLELDLELLVLWRADVADVAKKTIATIVMCLRKKAPKSQS